jgi:hypothetical protein
MRTARSVTKASATARQSALDNAAARAAFRLTVPTNTGRV